LAVQVQSPTSGQAGEADRVVTQVPETGILVDMGSTVTLTLESAGATLAANSAAGQAAADNKPRFVVCLDPGHQGHSDLSPEPYGPGSKKTKAHASGGATGVGTAVPEYEVALQISMNLKKRLEAQGVRVVMTRMTNDVNISNAERALKANKVKADLFVRVHGNGSPDSSVSGVATAYPGKNRWTSGISGRSKRAARQIQTAVIAQTSAVDRGIYSSTDMVGFNWSKVPVVLVECGFLSNSVEDRLLVSPHYQDELSEGMAAGIMAYLESEATR
jgi:N-acetylmuramoyl-L-alanine amidase